MRKRGTAEMIFVFAFIFLMIMIGVGIVGGVAIFFGSGYDFRQIEADLLQKKVVQCIFEKTIDWNNPRDFYENCRIKKEVVEKNNVLRVDVDGRTVINFRGDETRCLLAEKNPNFPRCNVVEFETRGMKFKVLTGSDQTVRRRG